MTSTSSDEYLRGIVEEASSIQERLDGPFEAKSGAAPELAQERLARWHQKISPKDDKNFLKRLDWMSTTTTDVLELLGDVRFKGPLPTWARFLDQALANLKPRQHSTADSQPFGALIAPFVEIGRELISDACRQHFTEQASNELIDDLAQELSHLAAPVFYLKFSVFRATEHTFSKDKGSTVQYHRFVNTMLDGGLKSTFQEYPVLARLLATVLENWVRNTLEMVTAVSKDLPELSDMFNNGEALGQVVGLELSLSDKHNGGRTVSILHFEGGTRIVFKPRNIQIESAWFRFLEQLNHLGGEFALLNVLAKGNYGWVEVASSAPCTSKSELERYYRRAGMLLCVMYGLEVSDCFFENILACRDYPMLIDMETLMHAVIRKSSDMSPAEEIADDIIFNSVYRAGFLPVWEMGPSGHCVDISGLGAKPGQVTSYVKRHWENLNTDTVELTQKAILVDTVDHLPSLNGESIVVADYTDSLVDGFQSMYQIFMQRTEQLTASPGLLSDLESTETRLVFHATRIYGLVLKRLGAPRHLRNGVDRSIEMDMISRFYLESRHKERFSEILNAEVQSMNRLDIPKFSVQANSRSLPLPTGVLLKNIFEEPAISRAHKRIRAFSDDDLQLQSEFIRASMKLTDVIVSHDSETKETGIVNDNAASCPNSELVNEAEEIAAELTKHAIWSKDGSATWVAAQLLPGANRHEFRPLRMDLYSGLSGIALFFSALQRVTGHGEEMAVATLHPVRRYLQTVEPERMVRDGYTLGAATGIGSFIATLTWCSEFLDDQALVREAIKGVEKITQPWISDDNALDLMSGSAGAIMGLLCLYERSQQDSVLNKAIECGNHLVRAAEMTSSEGLNWSTRSYLTGLSHGAAGIAAALFRLALASGQQKFADFAQRMTNIENRFFDPEQSNWPDLRNSDSAKPSFMHTWCHGAPGIGLARLAAQGKSHELDFDQDINCAAEATKAYGIGDRDGLCCGALGRADLFVTKSIIDQDENAQKLANNWAAQVIHRKRRAGNFRLTGRRGQEFFDPSFFQGLSGIGYQLLRTAYPNKLPSVLTWE